MHSLATKWDPCNEHYLAHTIREQKRIERLRQVRAQSREVATRIRLSVQEERERAIRELEERELKQKEAELRFVLAAAEREYKEAVGAIGGAQREAEQLVQETCGSDSERTEQHREEALRRKQRFVEARAALQREREAQHELETRRNKARERALQMERERAQLVANRSPPSPNPLEKLQASKRSGSRPRTVVVTDRSAFNSSHYHLVSDELVSRDVQPKETEAQAERVAESTQKQLASLVEERQRCEALQRERAKERGAAALKKETLRKHYTTLLQDLSTLQRLDTHRKAAHFYHVPRSLFLGNRQSDTERAREQRRMEERVEKLVLDEPVLNTALPLRVADERARLHSPAKSVSRLRANSVSPTKDRIAIASRSAGASPQKTAARSLRFDHDDDEVEPQPRSRPQSAVGDFLRDTRHVERHDSASFREADAEEPVPQHLASLYAQLRGVRGQAAEEVAEESRRTVERAVSPIRTSAERRVVDLEEQEAEVEGDRTLVEEEVQTELDGYFQSLPLPQPVTVSKVQVESLVGKQAFDLESARTANRLLESDRLRTIAAQQMRDIDSQLAATYRTSKAVYDSSSSRSTSRASDAVETMRQAAETDRTQSTANNLTQVQRSRVDSTCSSNPRTFSSGALDLTVDSSSSSRKSASRNRILEYQKAALGRLRAAHSTSSELIPCAVALGPPKQLDRSLNEPTRDVSVKLGSSFTATNVSSVDSHKSELGFLPPPEPTSSDSLQKLAHASEWLARLERYRQVSTPAKSDRQFETLDRRQFAQLADEGDLELANDAFVPHQLSVIREADGTSRFIVSNSQFQRSLLRSGNSSNASSAQRCSRVDSSDGSTLELSEYSHSSISVMTPVSNTDVSKDSNAPVESQKEAARQAEPDEQSLVDLDRLKKHALLRYISERSTQLASASSFTASFTNLPHQDASDDAAASDARSDDSASRSLRPATLCSPNEDAARGEALRTLMQSALTVDLAALSASYSSAISSRAASELGVPKTDDANANADATPVARRPESTQKYDSPAAEHESSQGHNYSTSSVLQTHAVVEKSGLSQLSLSTIENSGSPGSVARVATETSSSSADSSARFDSVEPTPSSAADTQSTVTPANVAIVELPSAQTGDLGSAKEDNLGALAEVDIGTIPHDESLATESDISLISLASSACTASLCVDDDASVEGRLASAVRSAIQTHRDSLQPDAVKLAQLVLSSRDDSFAPDGNSCSNASAVQKASQPESDHTLTDSDSDPNNNSHEERSDSGQARSRNVRFDENVLEINASFASERVRRTSQQEMRRPAKRSAPTLRRTRSMSAERGRKRFDPEREYRERTKRLWNQLDEVRCKREQRMRKQQYAANRERAQQFAKRIDDRRRKSQTSPCNTQVHSD